MGVMRATTAAARARSAVAMATGARVGAGTATVLARSRRRSAAASVKLRLYWRLCPRSSLDVKAKARKMGYLITMEDFLDKLQMYVETEGRIGRVRKGVVTAGINSSKMYWFVTEAREGSDADLKERVDSILGPHPNDREALDRLCLALQGRLHSIADSFGLLLPGVSEDWDVESDLFSELTQKCVRCRALT